MKTSTLYFATSNLYKFEEFRRLFALFGVTIEQIDLTVPEIQTFNIKTIIEDKVNKAYQSLSRPVLVDHSGLAMKALNGLPQGLNKEFWDVLKDQVCTIADRLGDDRAEVIVHLGFCDGQRIYTVSQQDPGKIARTPAPSGTFHIDRVFIPEGHSITLAEMSEAVRDKISHRRKVTEQAIALFRDIDFGKKLGIIS